MFEFYAPILVIGISFTTIGLIKLKEFNYLIAHGRKTEGRIIAIKRKTSRGNTASYNYPIFEYKSPKHGIMRNESDIGTTGNKYKVGQKIQIIFDKEDPSNSEIYNNFRLVIFPRLSTIIGLITLIVGFLILFEIINLDY